MLNGPIRVKDEMTLRVAVVVDPITQILAYAHAPKYSKTYNNTIQYNTLLTTPHGGFSVTMQLRKVTIVRKKTKINSKTLYYVCVKIK